MFISSTDCKDIFLDNTFDDFTIQLPREVELSCHGRFGMGTDWAFALTEITVADSVQSLIPESCIILCDLAESSYIKGSTAPVLRTITQATEKNGSLFQTYYIGSNKLKFNRLRIYIRNSNLGRLNKLLWGPNTTIKLILHFLRM